MDKPVNCGCGGEAIIGKIYGDAWTVECTECGIQSGCYDTEAEAIETWNKAMSGKDINVPIKERTTRVEYIAEVYKNEIVDHYLSGICGICGESTYDRAKYCSECGAKLDWS